MMSLILALIPAAIAVYIFHATCTLGRQRPSIQASPQLGDHTPPPPTTYSQVA